MSHLRAWVRLPLALIVVLASLIQADSLAAAPPAVNPGVEPVASRLADILKRNPRALAHLHQEWAVDLVLRTQDVESAITLLDACAPGANQLRFAGHICALLPDGVGGAKAREVLAKNRAQLNQVGTLEGLAIGYTQRGEITRALTEVSKLSTPAFERTLLAELMTIHPDRRFVDAFFKTPLHVVGSRQVGPLLRAQLILGPQDRAEELIREIREADAAKQVDPKAKTRISLSSGEAETLIFRATFFAHLAKGEIDQAVALEKQRYDAAIESAAQAREPKSAEARASSDRVNAYQAIVAVHALTGDAAEVKTSMDELPGVLKGATNVHLAALGAASAGRFAAGDEQGARAYVDEGLAVIAGLKGDQQQARGALQLLAGVILGPEALLYLEQRLEAYPLRLPNHAVIP